MSIATDLKLLQAGADGAPPLILDAEGGAGLVVPGGDMLLDADFVRLGPDLLLVGEDGAAVLVRGFFTLQSPPDLMTEGGAVIKAGLAAKLAGPMAPAQYAQAGPAAAESVGTVETVEGTVSVVRADGSEVTLAKGDSVYSGDVLETGAGGAIGIVFVDDTTFSLGEEGRMVLDEMVYDPGEKTGVLKTSLVQGVFSFVSGQIAKTSPEGMTVTTPVATIGVRGTTVAGRAAAEGELNTISLLPQTNAAGVVSVGEIVISNGQNTQVLNTAGATVQATSFFQPLPAPVTFSPAQIQQQYGNALQSLPPTPSPTGGDEGGAAEGEEAAAGEGEGEPGEGEGEEAPEGELAEGEGNPEGGPEGPGDAAEEAARAAIAAGATEDEAVGGPGGPGGPGEPGGDQFGIGEVAGHVPDVISNFFGTGDPLAADDPLASGNPIGGTGEDILGNFGDHFDGEGGNGSPFGFFGDNTNEDGVFIPPSFDDTLPPIIGPFDEVRRADSITDPLSGSSLNTNFYYSYSVASSGTGSETGSITDAGGANQLSFDELNDIRIKVEITSTPGNGTVTLYSDGFSDTGTNATISFDNITQYLFSDTSALSGEFHNESGVDPSQQTAAPTSEAGDVIVLPSLAASETGYVVAGTSSGETITFADSASGAIIFGKGGGDTFRVDSLGDHLIIGGITATDNVDDGSGGGTSGDGIPDAGINVFDYSLLNGSDFTSTGSVGSGFNDGTLGVRALLGGFPGEAGGEGLIRENVSDAANSRLFDEVWDVGSFIGSALNDTVQASSGGFNTIDLRAGNDTINLQGTSKVSTLIGGVGTDTLNMVQSSASATDVVFTGGTAAQLAKDIIAGFSGATAFGGGSGDGDKFIFDTSDLGLSAITYEEIAWDGSTTGLTLTTAGSTVVVLTGGTAGTTANAITALAAGNGTASDAIVIHRDSGNSDNATIVHTTDLAGGAGTNTAIAELSDVTTDVLSNLAAGDFGVVA